MNYIDFAIASSIFLIFFGTALIFSTNYFSNLSSLTKTSEFRSVSENFFKIFFETKGVPENWDENYPISPVKIGLMEDLYKITILLEETSGYNRTNELISRHIVFDENCENKTWNNTIRVFDEDYNEFVYKSSDETFCSSQYLKEANITWEVNISANQYKKFFIYHSPDNGVNFPTFTSNLTAAAVWHLDEGSGSTTYDETGNDNDGTLYGPTWTSDCKSGNCLSFDGSNDYDLVSDSVSLSITNGITIEAWINTGNATKTQQILGKGGTALAGLVNYEVFINNNEIYFAYRDSDTNTHRYVTNTDPISSDQNIHIAVTYTSGDGNSIKIFVNGSQQTGSWDLGNGNENLVANTRDLNIGRDPYGGPGSRYFNGTIDEVRVYNRALSPEEINTSYNATPLVKKMFPEEKITVVSATKFDALKNISYKEARKTIGENYKFSLEVGNETYGGDINMSANVGCSEYPKIVENKNGTVCKTIVKICVWK